MESKKLFVWLKVCFVFFLLNSCEAPPVVVPPDDPPVVEPEPIKFIAGYLNIQDAEIIKAYCILSDTSEEVIASSEFDNGNFKLLLPDSLDDKGLYNAGESDEYIELSCSDARGACISYMEVYRSPYGALPYRIGQVFYGRYFEIRNTPTEYYSHKVNKMWYYADKDVTRKGTRNRQGIIIDIIDLSLKKGWNEAYWEEILEVNRQTGAYTWTTTYTTTKSERYEGLEWYIWDETLW